MKPAACGESASFFNDAPFIVRERQLSQLLECFSRAVSGTGGLAAVEARSGRGKTRLIMEFERRLGADVLVLKGKGVAQSAQRPLQLFVGAADDLIAACAEDPALSRRLAADLEEQRDALLAVLPELQAIFEHRPEHAAGPETFGEDRSLRALTRFLGSLGAAGRPTVLLLDDCQWADDLSLKLLVHWEQALRRGQTAAGALLVVAAYRSEEVAAGHPLAALKAARHIRLEDFGEHETRLLLQSMAGNMAEGIIRLVLRLSGGSPFMASAVLRGLAEQGAIINPGQGWQFSSEAVCSDLEAESQATVFLRRRFELLGDNVLALLKIAAVLGRQFEIELAAAVAGHPLPAALAMLQEASRRVILHELIPGRRFEFAHDKLREALLEILSEEERRVLSLHTAATLSALQPDRVFELAYFFSAAQDYQRALPYARRAAQEARARCSLQLAEEQYRIALLGTGEENPEICLELRQGLGEVLMLRGRYQEAEDFFAAAYRVAHSDLDLARLDSLVGESKFKCSQLPEAGRALKQALLRLGVRVPRSTAGLLLECAWRVAEQAAHTVCPRIFVGRRPIAGAERAKLICRVLSRMAYVGWFGDEGLLWAFWYHIRALNFIERYQPSGELCHSYSSHGPAMTLVPYFSRGLHYTAKAVKLARALEDVWAEGQSLAWSGMTALAASRYGACIDWCLAAVRLLERSGDIWERNIANCNLAYGLYRSGGLAEAAKLARRTHEDAVESLDHQAAAVSLSVWAKAAGGDIDHGLIVQAQARTAAIETQALTELAQAEALYWLKQGRLERAVAILEEAWRKVIAYGFKQEYLMPVVGWLLTALRRQIQARRTGSQPLPRGLRRRTGWVLCQALWFSLQYRNNLPHTLREAALLADLAGRRRLAGWCFRRSLAAAEKIHANFECAYTLAMYALAGLGWGWVAAPTKLTEASAALQTVDGYEVFLRLEGLADEADVQGAARQPQIISTAVPGTQVERPSPSSI